MKKVTIEPNSIGDWLVRTPEGVTRVATYAEARVLMLAHEAAANEVGTRIAGYFVTILDNVAVLHSPRDKDMALAVLHGETAAGVIGEVLRAIYKRGAAPQARVAHVDLITAQLRANQKKFGREYWQNLVHLQMDMEAHGIETADFYRCLFELWEGSVIELKDGFNRIRFRAQEDASRD